MCQNSRPWPRSSAATSRTYSATVKLDGAMNDSMERFNAMVRWLIKQAYGFRDFKYFRLKTFDLSNASKPLS